MNANTILEGIREISPEAADSLSVEMISQWLMTALIAVLVIGLLWSLFGLKLIRVWAALLGLTVGFTLGTLISMGFQVESKTALIIGGVAGLVLACLGAVFYRVGIFLVAWIAGIGISAAVIGRVEWYWIVGYMVFGLVLALLSLKFPEGVTIVVTSIIGAVMAGPAIAGLLHLENPILSLVFTIAVAALGMLLQFLMESGKRKRRNLKKAEQIRKENSTENEVEKARAMMDEEKWDDDIVYIDDEK